MQRRSTAWPAELSWYPSSQAQPLYVCQSCTRITRNIMGLLNWILAARVTRSTSPERGNTCPPFSRAQRYLRGEGGALWWSIVFGYVGRPPLATGGRGRRLSGRRPDRLPRTVWHPPGRGVGAYGRGVEGQRSLAI